MVTYPKDWEEISVNDLIHKGFIKTISPSIKLKNESFLPCGMFPVISQESEYISGYTNCSDEKINENEYICFGEHSENIKYVNFKFVQGADGLKILFIDKNKIIPKFLFFSLLSNYQKHENYE